MSNTEMMFTEECLESQSCMLLIVNLLTLSTNYSLHHVHTEAGFGPSPTADKLVEDSEPSGVNSVENQFLCLTPGCIKAGKI